MNLRHINMQYEPCLNAIFKKGTLTAYHCTGAKRARVFASVAGFRKVYVTRFA